MGPGSGAGGTGGGHGPSGGLLRHGESEWNKLNLFTGWYDADLTPLGEEQARAGGALMAEQDVVPDVVHTSLQTRAIRTADLQQGVTGNAVCDR